MTTQTHAGYAWRIDKDHLFAPGEQHNSDGRTGPRNADPALLDKLAAPEQPGTRFQLLDDDKILVYEGRLVFAEGYEASAEDTALLGPLYDYGRGAGCTLMNISTDGGATWERLVA